MSEARLRALRLTGFKSFAERTEVELGPGISAIVGPNGAGKSNLADALRWALGEQGRSLRTRRAEDVIFAGSSSRRAIGMADVTLVIDNRDRLLPVDYGEVELGRRLYRSGENEYLLNRQRVRLRDLTDLLDAANIADNAFLFIGQGMVDQALALRPEERRPLFEEAAGVRRHDRRRRRAESDLAEAEANLERVRDLLAELRPQARRLAAQAEQQQARRSAGLELAEALVAGARERILSLGGAAGAASAELAAARAESDAAMAELRGAEDVAGSLSDALTDRAEAERILRDALDAARVRTLELRLQETRLSSEDEALQRDIARGASEREGLDRRIAEARLELVAGTRVERSDTAERLAALDAEVAAAAADVRAAREGMRDAGEGAARDEREAERAAEALERAGRRLAEADRDLRAIVDQAASSSAAAEGALARHREAVEVAASAAATERSAEEELETARRAAAADEAAALSAEAAAGSVRSEASDIAARLRTLDGLVGTAHEDPLSRRARARGGRRLAEGLDVDRALRPAVDAALGDAVRAIVLGAQAARTLVHEGGGRGALVIGDHAPRPRDRDAARVEAAAAAAGGGPLAASIRRDPGGTVTRLLERTVWVPGIEAALQLQAQLPAGWRTVTASGDVVESDGLVRLGRGGATLDAFAERERLASRSAEVAADVARKENELASARARRDAAAAAVDAARERLDAARRARRIADEDERAAGRRAEAHARERAWQDAQRERLERQLAAARREASAAEARRSALDAGRAAAPGGREGASPEATTRDRVAEAERRLADARAARADVAEAVAVEERAHREADEKRRRAEIRITMDEARIAELDTEAARLAGHVADVRARREKVLEALSVATVEEEHLGRELAAASAGGAVERAELVAAERRAAAAREDLRAAETRARAAEVREMESRLQLDATREALLVELAGIGADGLTALRIAAAAGPGAPEAPPPPPDELAPVLERALDDALARWREGSGPAHPATPPPAAGRLASLRRRYHDLGAGNPFAAEEYAEISVRLEALEAQRADLEAAIRSTRELIGSLSSLIAHQFRQTFAALEGAFARRFRQLFDGGDAELSLTAPDDLSATGVEITARPPGKKRQPLAMLSGGERALTAVALLLAMLEVRPVPFCVLDEVDAALDEANIGRFSAALRGLSERIQFVVITHNRGTIEGADALYGVTLSEDAVSRVVSLRLTDAVADTGARDGGRPAGVEAHVDTPVAAG